MPHGSIEVVVFPEAFKQHGHLAENGRMRPRARDGSSATTSRRGFWRRRSPRSRWCGNGSPRRWPSGCRRRRTAARRSSGCWDVFAQHKGDRRVAFDIARAGPASARDRRRQRADPGAALRTAGVRRREDLRRRIGEPAVNRVAPRSRLPTPEPIGSREFE